MEQGIYHNISSKDYHAMPEIISNSYLGRLAKVPAAAKIPQDETEAMKFGRAFHCYVLEGQQSFWNEFCIPDSFPTKPNRRSTQKTIDTYNLWIASLGDKIPITQGDFDTIQQMQKAVMTHPSASKFLAEGISETTIIWQDEETGLFCKCRPDRIPEGNKGVILDLKSTSNASKNAFQSDCVKFGYAREGAIYLEGFSRIMKAVYMDLIFACIAVEKEPPYRTEVYTIETDFLEWGFAEFHRLLQIEKICRDNNFYPHYNCAGVDSLFKPAYLKTWEFEPIDETMKDYKLGDKP
jgi:hypothetical protein